MVFAQWTDAPATAQREAIQARNEARALAEKAEKKLDFNMWQSLLAGGLSALIEGVSYFLNKLAYDAATWLSTKAAGEEPLVFQEGAATYFENVALDAAAQSIQTLGEKAFGIDICQPNLALQISLQLGLSQKFMGGGLDCSWQDLKNAYSPEAFEEKFGPYGQKFIAESFSASLNADSTDFGVSLGALGQVRQKSFQQELGALQERMEGDGFKAVKELISGTTISPAQLVKEESKELTGLKSKEITAGQISAIYAAPTIQILPYAASVFLNTLTTQLLEQLLTGGLFPSSGGGGEDAANPDSVVNPYSQSPSGASKKSIAQQVFGFLLTKTPVQIENFNIVQQFTACPEGNTPVGINNCVMEQGLANAIAQAKTGRAMTIGEALADTKGSFLHGDWELISPKRELQNRDRNCFREAYCYSNIQKIRKARILPIGFEIAALKSPSDNPWKLEEVVKGFDQCHPSGAPSAEYPYCHLIDPNWVIRVPETRCMAYGYSDQLLTSDGAKRMEECLDFSTCISEGPNSVCEAPQLYGYCTKEENTWRIPGDSCPLPFTSCQTFVNAGTNTVSSYLTRTLEYGECSAQSVGCSAYGAEQVNEAWVYPGMLDSGIWKEYKKAGRNPTLYFNAKIASQTCTGDNEGCSAFYPRVFDAAANAYVKDTSPENTLYLKKAPDYLGCYDTNAGTEAIEYPKKKADLNFLSGNPECGNFAGACVAEEVGCDAYTPLAGGPAVPALIGNNQCDLSCVGYDAYKQAETNFEGAQFPLYFVPTYAQDLMKEQGLSCTVAYEGCDEFTNIDTVEKGGEGLEYYTDLTYCEKPADDNEKIFYSWEGSVQKGYVLRTHRLLQIDDTKNSYLTKMFDLVTDTVVKNALTAAYPKGSPAYADTSYMALKNLQAVCNEDTYSILVNNPGSIDAASLDCRALYDKSGQVFYRVLSEVALVDELCHPLRKTSVTLVKDDLLSLDTSKQLCAERKGLWAESTASCMVCANGGAYKPDENNPASGGSCVYNTINTPGQANACPKEASGCRLYVGNSGNNVEQVFLDIFEPSGDDANALNDAKKDWKKVDIAAGSISVAAESIQVGLYSLLVNTEKVERIIATGTIQSGNAEDAANWYELSFWARGVAGQQLSINLSQNGKTETSWYFTFDPLLNKENKIELQESWQLYHIGPVQFTGNTTDPVSLVFKREGTPGGYFLDNVRLTRLVDQYHLIKNSWQRTIEYEGGLVSANAPIACDSDPTDGLPGEALGCQMYTDTQNTLWYATGFASLCRPEAVGCTALYDTQNTIAMDGAEDRIVYNIACYKNTSSGNTCTVNLNGANHTCTPPTGSKICYIPGPIALPDATYSFGKFELQPFVTFLAVQQNSTNTSPDILFVDDSSVLIGADTPENDPIFLTKTKNTVCDQAFLGCEKIALREQAVPDGFTAAGSYSFEKEYIKNNPDKYLGPEGVLCREDLLGCGQFNSGNTVSFFKDPLKNGNAQCVYQESFVDKTGITRSGWVKKDVGECTNGSLCTADQECASGMCQNKNKIPCYPGYILADTSFGIYSNGAFQYDGLVGQCPEQFNGCTELVDPVDKTAKYPNGTPYPVIFNSTITNRIDECGGKVSLKEGCVLLNKVDESTRPYLAQATYTDSEKNNDNLVSPKQASSVSGGDSNIILKVNRDRVCAEWLACRSSQTKQQQETGLTLDVCEDYRACTERDGKDCVDWVEQSDYPHESKFLTEEKYIARDTTWYGDPEYTGYSLFNRYQINDFTYIGIDSGTTGKTSYLAYKFYADSSSNPDQSSCFKTVSGNVVPKNDGALCGEDSKGKCYSGECVYPISGLGEKDEFTKDDLIPASCKVYPEEDSPFPVNFAKDLQKDVEGNTPSPSFFKLYTQKIEGYDKANICQKGDCSCSYLVNEYADGNVGYWPLGQASHGPRTCQLPADSGLSGSGEVEDAGNIGKPCQTDDGQCGDGLICKESPYTNKSMHVGTSGFCLERDLSRPLGGGTGLYACQTWLPLDVNVTGVDIYNNDPTTGYDVALDSNNGKGQVYCTVAAAAPAYNQSMVLSGVEMLKAINYAYPSSGLTYSKDMYYKIFHSNSLTYDDSDAPVYIELEDILGPEIDDLAGDTGDERWTSLLNAPPLWVTWWSDGGTQYDNIADLPPMNIPKGATTGELGSDLKLQSLAYQKKIYTFMKLYGWHGINDGKGSPNTEVLWIDSPGWWSMLSEKIPVTDASGYIYTDVEETKAWDEDGKGKTPIAKYIIGTFGKDYRMQGDLYEQDVKKFHMGPMMLAGDPGAYNELNLPHFYPGLEIDFENLQAMKIDNPQSPLHEDAPKDETYAFSVKEFALGKTKKFQAVQFFGINKDAYTGDSNDGKHVYGIAIFQSGEDDGNTIYRSIIEESLYNVPIETQAKAPYNVWMIRFNNGDGKLSYDGGNLWYKYSERYKNDDDDVKNHAVGRHALLSVLVELNPRCTEFASVYDDTKIDTDQPTNKAWTNRVWQASQIYPPSPHWDVGEPKFFSDEVKWFETENPPYGSLDLIEDDLETDSILRKYTFNDNQGVPYACGKLFGKNIYAGTNELNAEPVADDNIGPSGSDYLWDYMWQTIPDWSGTNDFRCSSLGDGLTIPGDMEFGIGSYYASYDPDYIGKSRLAQLFAKTFSIKMRKTGEKPDEFESKTAWDEGSEYNKPTNNRPPVVYSLNPYRCYGEHGPCTAGDKHNFTVTGKNGTKYNYDRDPNNDPDEAPNNAPEPTMHIAQKTFKATAEFFVAADDNHMPIRRIMIDWDDSATGYITNEKTHGYYENYKPFCEFSEGDIGVCWGGGSEQLPDLMTCKAYDKEDDCPHALGFDDLLCYKEKDLPSYQQTYTDSYNKPRFGNSDRACVDKPFKAEYTYECSSGSANVDFSALTEWQKKGVVDLVGYEPSKVCAYRPRVQVLDNWGWCNASKSSATGGPAWIPGGKNKDMIPSEEGLYNDFNAGGNKECEDNYNKERWTYYHGVIIVVPEQK